jgi:hypothetical protein
MEEGTRISRVTFVDYAEQKALPLSTPALSREFSAFPLRRAH